VRPERFELPTCCSGGNRSIQLSYGRAVITVYMGRRMGGNAGALLAVGWICVLRLLPPVAPASSTSAAAIPATATPASAAALSFRTSLIDVDGTASDLRSVQRRNCLLAIFVTVHLDKAETARSPCVTVGHDADTIDLTVCLKELPQFIFACIKAQVPHKDILHASAPALSCRNASSVRRTGRLERPSWKSRPEPATVKCGRKYSRFLRNGCQ
jgi:hypothetical protein